MHNTTLEDYYAQFKNICEELSICQPISTDIRSMQQQRGIHLAWFLFGLPSSFDPVKAQILVHKELPTLSGVFNCLHQASVSDSSTKIHPHSFDRSAFNTIAGVYGNRGLDQEGG